MSKNQQVESNRFVRFLASQGISRNLAWGFVALTLFLVGDGIELSFLANYLTESGFTSLEVAGLFSAYGIVVAVAAWLAGALAEAWGPRRVMLIGGAVWIALEVVFLIGGVATGNYTVMLAAYAVRGIGFPFFAYGFLVWITMETPNQVMGKAVGWYWFFNSMGLGVISGYYVAAVIGAFGPMVTLWTSLGFVVIATIMIATMVRPPSAARRITRAETLQGLTKGFTIMKESPRVAVGGIVRLINTVSYYAFPVFLSVYMVQTVGFSSAQWASIWGTTLAANVVANLVAGYASDRFGRINVIAWGGGVATAVTILGLFYAPQAFGANYVIVVAIGIVYGFALGMYVPLSAVVPLLAPHHKAAAVAVLNLGAGLSNFAGPLMAALVAPWGITPVIWLLAALYIGGFFLTFLLRAPGVEATGSRGRSTEDDLVRPGGVPVTGDAQ